MLQLSLQVTNSLLSIDRRHGALRAVDLATYGPTLRQNRMRFQLLTDHKDVHLGVRSWLVEILDVVHDTVLRHLITSS